MPGRIALPPPFAPAVAVNRCTYRIVHLANYRYGIPAHRVRTVLRLLPPLVRGYQRRLEENIYVAPLPYEQPRYEDEFGNVVVEVLHEGAQQNLTLAVEAVVETRCAYTEEGLPLPTALLPSTPDEDIERFRETTGRTAPDDALIALAHTISAQADPDTDPLGFLIALGDRVYREMTFRSGATGVETTAAEAWAGRRGVCQDYAHITLTLLRLCGVPARYVSGFVPGEGVMHAWVEAFLPVPGHSDLSCWFAFDPTYNQWVSDSYIAVAIGRDYADITPTSGTYYGGPNHLTYRNRVERLSKEIILL